MEKQKKTTEDANHKSVSLQFQRFVVRIYLLKFASDNKLLYNFQEEKEDGDVDKTTEQKVDDLVCLMILYVVFQQVYE